MLVIVAFAAGAGAQDAAIAAKLQGFDAWMAKTLKDWNAPGIGVGIVAGDKLVFAKGYGFRDVEKMLPFTPQTLAPIASNSKLFTAVAAGMLVEEGKLEWDRPIREKVPSIRFHDDELNATVTLRDMLAHRTGITRHDTIWYRSDFTRQELFDRLVYMEPKEPLRQMFIYNNMMYAASGWVIELQSGKTWEEFVRERIFRPLGMGSTVYTIAELEKSPDHGVPFTERRDSFELYRIPYYEDTAGMAPAGAIVSNVEDMSHWLIALMNGGEYAGTQVVPTDVLKATLQPAIALPNAMGETRGFWEILNPVYGMGRWTASYRGHQVTYHGGDIDGFHSQVSFMPQEKIGVVVFVIGDHCASLYNTVTWNVYERLLGMSQTPWSERMLEIRLKGKKANAEARAKAGAEKVAGTSPSHPLADYAGTFDHPAYGALAIGTKGAELTFDFHNMELPLAHFHYDRFDTPNDEQFGQWTVSFLTNPQGDVDKAVMSLDEAEVTFTRRPETVDPALKAKLAGAYETETGAKFQVVLEDDGSLALVIAGRPAVALVPYKGLTFKVTEFADVTFEFVVEDGTVKALKERTPGGEFSFARK
ncbi:MAG: serine hydrolase [Acidobacteria bacterium]|nr:serine hydrolase [Acidobacteriota bacterium]